MESAQNDNPSTAIGSESESETTPFKKAAHLKRKKRRKSHRFEPNFDIPGVYKITLPDLTQEFLGCVVGENVTVEKPWIHVDKDLIQEHVDIHTGSSVFLPIKKQISDFPKNEILIGYIPDESKTYDEFYICVTEEATEAAGRIIERMRQINEDRLQNAVYRKVKFWNSLGSETEVEEGILRRHRSLIEVEIESKYPCLPFKIHFKLTRTQDLRDGYMELRPVDGALSTIFRKRVDAFVQVVPNIISHEAQTVCTYPKNSFTQYEYEIPKISFDSKSFKDYMAENLDLFCDILRVNGCIDLYSNDYENLAVEDKFTIRVLTPEPKEYNCFIDLNLSGGKMISSAEWHPMWSGCVICAYIDTAPAVYLNSKPATDQVYKAVHDSNPVLFWSLNDNLKPKLILEAPRPVYVISCCPYDPNLILGGMVNGQIILWDITNKLQSVEQEEILTVDQQKYREYMFSLMNWMKNIFDLAHVRPAALSDFNYAHKGCLRSISWMSPFHRITKTGNFEEIAEDEPHSLQFVSVGEAGVMLFWDLLKVPTKTAGSFKGMRKGKRLSKRPSGLIVMDSPFKNLHLNLRPIYRVNLFNPSIKTNLPVGSCQIMFYRTHYKPNTQASYKRINLSDRVHFSPNLSRQDAIIKKNFYVGTLLADYVQGTWEGQDFDPGEIVNWENAQFLQWGRYHDGPIVCVDYNPINDTILTVGGKIFALWRDAYKGRPVIWRKCSSIYTHGEWFHFEAASMRLIRMDGAYEIWTLFYQSKTALDVHLMSNGPATMAISHPRRLKYNLIGLCDYRGSFRLYYKPHTNPIIVKAKEEYMSQFLTKEIERKKKFLQWQEQWNKRFASRIQKEEDKKDEAVIRYSDYRLRKVEKKKNVKITPGMRYLGAVQEQQRLNEQKRIKDIILMKKQLNTENLLKQREPLRHLEEEQEMKRRHQKQKLKESVRIFKNQVAVLFPDVVKEKPPLPVNPYEDCYSEEIKWEHFQNYNPIFLNAKNYIDENPFSYEFSWGSVLRTGHEKRRKYDEATGRHSHKARFAAIKEEKLRATAAAKSAELGEATKATEESIGSSFSRSTLATA